MSRIQTYTGEVIPALAFVGHSGSGKTTLVEKIIALLCDKGYKVGSVKHHGHAGFEVDVPGKDSWRHVQAGSQYTIISAPDKVVDIHKTPKQESLLVSLKRMHDVDVCIVEGFRRGDIDTIEVAREANNDLQKFTGFENGQVALVTDIAEVSSQALAQTPPLPVFAFEETEAIANFIIDFLDLDAGKGTAGKGTGTFPALEVKPDEAASDKGAGTLS